MRKFFAALLLGALIMPASAPLVSNEALAIGSKHHTVKIEKGRDAKNQKIQIRRTFDRSGKLVRTTYFVKTPNFGLTPGYYNRHLNIVTPYFEADGHNRGR